MLTLARKEYDDMIAHAKAGAPLEACGLLGGKMEGEGPAGHRTVSTFYPMSNPDQSPIHFTLDPKEQFHVMKEMRNRSEELIGIFHSHVASPPRPSAEDIRQAHYPGISYILVSLMADPPTVRSYVIQEGKVTEEELTVR